MRRQQSNIDKQNPEGAGKNPAIRQKGPNRLVSGFQINRIKITDMRKKENTQKLNDLAKNKGSELMYLVSG